MEQNRDSENLMTDTLTLSCHGVFLRIYTSMYIKNLHLFNTRERTVIQPYYGKSAYEDRIRVLQKKQLMRDEKDCFLLVS